MTTDTKETYPQPKDGWVCFHCGERFKTPGSAADHFGSTPDSKPACMIKVGNERGLVMALRTAEDEIRQQRDTLTQANEEIAQLREALPDPDKLEILAGWFDYKYPVDPRPEVQTNLRAWAKKVRAVLHQEPPKGE